MPKIYVLTTVHSRYDVRVFLKQCRSIASTGYEVNLLVQDGKGNECRDGVTITDLGLPPSGRLRRILFSPWKMYNYVRSVQADIVHFHDPELLPVAFLLKRAGRRVVYDSHEDFPRQVLSKHWITPRLRKSVSVIFEVFENSVARNLDAVVCATPFIANRFKALNNNAVDVNNFPLEEEFHQPEQRQKQPFSRTICYIGAMTRERGISELVKALELLQNVTLIMCGPFESEAYAAELRGMPGWRFVDYRGIVGRVEVGDIMARSAAGVVTFLPGPNHNDSQPNKMFEYMSAGLPLIASHFPLWRDIVEKSNCGICVDPASPKEIAGAISTLLADENLCLHMAKAGREAISSRFNWSNESDKLLKLYDEVLTQEKPAWSTSHTPTR